MLHRTLGKTGLSASVAALGCGGPSRLGLRHGQSEAHAASIVDLAINLGVNTIDTAESYGTEPAVARAIKNHDRSKLIISTKKSIKRPGPFHTVALAQQAHKDAPELDRWLKQSEARPYLTPELLRGGLENSLRRLGTDYIDIYFFHAVLEHELDHAVNHLLPELHKLRDEGKLRFTAVSEMFAADTDHKMLKRAINPDTGDSPWDVVMVGFSMLNQSAREPVLQPIANAERTGTADAPGSMSMFTVRKALRNPEKYLEYIEKHAQDNTLRARRDDAAELVRMIEDHPDIASLPNAAYRFCAHEPGMHTVLTGTGNPEHLKQNVKSITAPPLPADVHAAIVRTLGRETALSGN